MKNKKKIMFVAGNGILIALTIALSFLTNYADATGVNFNLALVTIVIAACLYGPVSGLIMGLVNGALTIVAPATIAFFIPESLFGTILVCLLKTGIAGLVSGFVYKAFKNKNVIVASLLAGLVVPFVNTGLFICGTLIWFMNVYQTVEFVFASAITINFAVEVGLSLVLSPVVYRIITVIKNRMEENEDQSETNDSIESNKEENN